MYLSKIAQHDFFPVLLQIFHICMLEIFASIRSSVGNELANFGEPCWRIATNSVLDFIVIRKVMSLALFAFKFIPVWICIHADKVIRNIAGVLRDVGMADLLAFRDLFQRAVFDPVTDSLYVLLDRIFRYAPC